MRLMNMKTATFKTQLFLALAVAVPALLAPAAFAAVPGITDTGTAGTFNLTAQDAYLNQPDGNAIYSWGYGCASGSTPTFDPDKKLFPNFPPTCSTMQVPGPTMIVTEGSTVTIKLTNNLPTAAGNTSILFPGLNVTTSCAAATPVGQQGLLTCEAAPGASVTYTLTASNPGTHAYYSGTQGDLQIEMGLYGAIIVLPAAVPTSCDSTVTNLYGKQDYGSKTGILGFPEQDFRLAHAAYDHPRSCYDREYLFQWAEMDTRIHRQAEAEVRAKAGCPAGTMGCSLDVQTEPYHPAYFLINGRSMPDLMDPNYASEYPHQPYNGNPHMHPGELTLIRTIGQGRWQHPFHEHANHVRILARDGNLILSPTAPGAGGTRGLAGTLMFNTDTTPGEAFDGIFYFTGRGLNWDPYGHHPAGTGTGTSQLPITRITESGDTVTVTFAGNEIPATGTPVVISGVNPSGYDGTFTIASSSAGASSNTITFTDTNPDSLTFTGISESGNTVTVTTSATLPALLVGTQVKIAGVVPAGYNGTFSVASVAANGRSFTYTNTSSGLTAGTHGAGTSATFSVTFSLATATSGAVTMSLGADSAPNDPLASLPCYPDSNGYYTTSSNPPAPTWALNYYEWCQDHNKPVQVAPFGDVASGGPATLPDPNVLTNGQWYNGSPYLGPDAALRGSMPACDVNTNSNCTNLMPSNTQANPSNERGWAFMWHSHNEREITTNNVFPGGMLMMMLVDSREFPIDESQ